MYLKLLSYLFFTLSVAFLQISFVPVLPSYFGGLNLILVFLLYSVLISGFERTVYFALGIGLLMDYYSFSLIGTYALCFAGGVAIVYFLLNNLLTNRSLYSLLALFSVLYLYFKIYFIAGNELFSVIQKVPADFSYDQDFFAAEAYTLLVNLVMVTAIYYLFNMASKSLKPTFLKR